MDAAVDQLTWTVAYRPLGCVTEQGVQPSSTDLAARTSGCPLSFHEAVMKIADPTTCYNVSVAALA